MLVSKPKHGRNLGNLFFQDVGKKKGPTFLIVLPVEALRLLGRLDSNLALKFTSVQKA